jgi:hypothetical protein
LVSTGGKRPAADKNQPARNSVRFFSLGFGSAKMLRRSLALAGIGLVLLAVQLVNAQPPKPGDLPATPPLGVDKFYFDLLKSDNATTRATAERYIGLVKVQEWSDLSGKFKAVAHYVKHDANLSMVTIAVMKGQGSDRTADEKTVPVDKLSKTCQVRVKQIDLLQKKLKEAAAKANPGSPGAPMTDEHGADPNAKGPDAGPGAPPPGTAGPDPSASEPDPLGFAEVQLAPAAGPGAPPSGGPGSIPPGAAGPGPGGNPSPPGAPGAP